jgi:hypothetical protein
VWISGLPAWLRRADWNRMASSVIKEIPLISLFRHFNPAELLQVSNHEINTASTGFFLERVIDLTARTGRNQSNIS